MNRRAFLATASTGSLAAVTGCLGDVGGDSDDATRTLRLDLASAPTPLRSGHVVDLAETKRPDDERTFEATRAGETVTTTHRRPFGSRPGDPAYTRREGTYYRLGSVVVDEATAVRPVVRLSAVGDVDSADAPAAVAADSLSTTDQRVVHVAHVAARARGNEGGVPWGMVQRGGYVFRDDVAAGESRLLADDGPSHVAYRGTVYAVQTERERFHDRVYRATVEPVAESPARMEAILRAQFVDARLSSERLSNGAQSLLREARGEGYGETHPYSAAYRTVLTALHARAYLDGTVEKDAYVEDPGAGILRYDGTYYDYRLQFLTVDG